MNDLFAALLCLPFIVGPLILLAVIVAKRVQGWTVCK
jgi:hypothetical protein